MRNRLLSSTRRASGEQKSQESKDSRKGNVKDAFLQQKRHRFLKLARVLLALPNPAYLVFSAIQYGQVDTVTAGWGLSASFTQLKTGRTFAVVVVLLAIPIWIFSLLVAQHQKNGMPAQNNDRAIWTWPWPCSLLVAQHQKNGMPAKHNDRAIWTWPMAFETALFFGSSYAYSAIYNTYNWTPYVIILLASLPVLALVLFTITQILRSIVDYQYDQKLNYLSFLYLQASRLGILTIFGACLSVYALSAMSRVVIRYELLDPFAELSLNGITCTDRDAFWSAFEASAANTSCAALPNCGYASFEKLCRAVQYAPMVGAVDVDLSKVLVFVIVAWLLISLLVFGTGRANPNDDYAHLLSPHMLVAMVLGLGQTMNTLYAFMRLLLIVPLLRLPRPAAYFDEKGVMDLELPLYCHGSVCNYADYFGTMLVHVLIFIVINFDFLKRYASLIGGGQVAIDKLKNDMKKKGEWSEEEPYFYFLPSQVVLDCKTRSLPPMQTLRDVGHLETKKIKLIDAFNGNGIIKNILFVSHRWEEPGRPDVNGVQLKAIQEYLKGHSEIDWVWFDYSSMPQKTGFPFDTRTREEKAEFELMLSAITDLYLTSRVLILLDGSYASRFWTLTEAWCSMQTATSDGLRPATEAERRYTIKSIHTADETHDKEGLVQKVSQKTPDEIFLHLSKPDVNVTNANDKKAILDVIKKTNEHVKNGFRNDFKKQKSASRMQSNNPGHEVEV